MTEDDGTPLADDMAIAVDIGTGCVGNVIEVVLGDVVGIAIFGAAALGSRRTCLVVLISFGGMGCVGNCTIGGTAESAEGDTDTPEPCGCKVDAGKGCRIVLTTADADDGNEDNICVACTVDCIEVAEVSFCGLNIVTPAGNGVSWVGVDTFVGTD